MTPYQWVFVKMETEFHKKSFNISAVNRYVLLACIFFTCSCSSLIGSSANYGMPSSRTIHYTVKKGDTLSAIASRYRTTPAQIASANNLRVSTRIKIGQILKVKTNSENQLAANRTSEFATQKINTQTVTKTYSGRMTWPVGNGGGRLTSKFGKRNGGNHDGIDIASPKGTPVLASHDGRVIYADNKLRGYGKVIILRGSGNVKTVYAHNSKLLVKTDQRVRQGQKIAEIGSTGRSTGNHLHYEIRSVDRQGRNIAVDPLPILTRSSSKANYRVTNNITAIFVADEKRNGK